MADLCTVQDVELYTGESYDDNDPSAISQIEYLISSVSAEIENICNRKFNADSYDEKYDIDGREVNLNQYPIIEVTTVEYGSPFGGEALTALTSDEYITYDTIGAVRINFKLRRADQYVNVVYTAGYETIPDDLNLITVKAVVDELQKSNSDTTVDSNIKTIKTGDASNTYFTASEKVSISTSLRQDLVNYMKCDI